MSERISRRELLEKTAFAVVSAKASPFPADSFVAIDSFDRPDSTYHGDDWETLTPGFWRIQNQALSRDLANLGEAPYGMLWNRHWNLRSNYTIEADFSLKKRMSNSGQGLMGICFGGKSLYESWHGGGNPGDACWYAAWRDNGRFGIYDHSSDRPVAVTEEAQFDSWSIDQTITLRLRVTHSEDGSLPTIDAELVNVAGAKVSVKTDRRSRTEGCFGIVSRGLLGFRVSQVRLLPGTNRAEAERLSDLIVAYPLATSLKKAREGWFARFVCLFRQEGKEALIRVSTRSTPAGGWNSEAVAGRAPIVQNSFRENTAVIEAKLPGNPSETEFYYTAWKDGKDVTVDPRGAPYAGRLPRLTAPYHFAGLSCHAISAKQFRDPEKCFPWKVDPAGWRSVSRVEAYENAELFQSNWVFEQALPTAFQHFEEYGFQILLWEDDIWYLEIPIFPPTVRDVYRTIGLTLGGRVQRRQMMRHWNVLNPGDHDFGMDDFKGTEQYAVRTVTSLPQNQNYLRQNFAAVWHLLTGEEENHSTSQPVRYTAWRLPDGDCTLVVTDARLWRTTQAGYLWEKNGWEGRLAWKRNDPTRALLGEAQYAWLQSVIRTAPSPVIVVTGLNALHTIWNRELQEDDRVMADYAGFNKVSCDRLIDLLTSRDGIISLYGDVHVGCILRNREVGLVECSFGPTARWGGRALHPNFGPAMRDWDGRSLEVLALYHQNYQSPQLSPQSDHRYWNFLELVVDSRSSDPEIRATLRQIADPVTAPPRVGGELRTRASLMGKQTGSYMPSLKTLPAADVLVLNDKGDPIRAIQAGRDGFVRPLRLPGTPSGHELLVVARRGTKSFSKVMTSIGSPPSAPVNFKGS